MKIIMFHYVMEKFNYFHFDVNLFENYIKILKDKYTFIGIEEAKKIINQENSEKYMMLTFDDGTKDHYEYVYPILNKYNIKGVFFVGTNIFYGEILDIHLIHRLIAKVGINRLYDEIKEIIDEKHISINVNEFTKNIDGYKMRYVKQLLQYVLPEEIREWVLQKLIKKYYISQNLNEYYITYNEMLEMKKKGMDFGIHTRHHKRLELLNKDEQKVEIENDIEILKEKKILTNTMAIAYPFGSYNQDTLDVLNNLKVDLGFTIKRKFGSYKNLEIERIDCNELKNYV